MSQLHGMVCDYVAFTKTMGITKVTQTTKTARTATNKRVECWISANHANHGHDENHGNARCANWEPVDPVVADPVRQNSDKRKNIQICRTPQLVGNFEALRFIEAEEKIRQKKAKEEKN